MPIRITGTGTNPKMILDLRLIFFFGFLGAACVAGVPYVSWSLTRPIISVASRSCIGCLVGMGEIVLSLATPDRPRALAKGAASRTVMNYISSILVKPGRSAGQIVRFQMRVNLA